jgi:peptidyl-prolyl cis-trans isomerase D
MSIIQNIRERGAWIIFGIIAIALIAFILQDGIGRKKGTNDTTTLGKVNGQVINKIEFDEKLDIQLQQYASQGVKREQLIGYLWEQEISRLLFKTEADKLSISVGNKELNDVLFGDDSPFKQEFTDKSTGEFKVNDAKNTLAQIKKSKNKEQINQIEKLYIEPAVENRIRNKYQALVVRGVQIPKWLAEKQFAELNNIASFNVVQIPYTTIADSTVKVTDDDISSYLKNNAAAYQNEETTRTIGYIGFSAAPTAPDSLVTKNELMGMKQAFKDAPDVAIYLNKVGTELPYYNSYISKKTLQIPEKDSVLNAGVGNTYGPYVDGKFYTIAKIIGVKQWPDSTSVRHILIATNNPQNGQQIKDDSTAKKLIDSIAFAIKNGASFEALCDKYSDDGGSKPKGGNLGMFGQAQMVPAFNDYAFDNPVGTKGVIKTDFGYHYIEILKQTTSGPAYKIAYLSKSINPSNETINTASTAAAQFAATCKNSKTFNENAVKLGKQVLPAAGIKLNDFDIQGLGETRQLVRWVYEKNVNDVSEPFEIGDTYIVAVITNEEKAGLASVASAKSQVEGIIRDQKKAAKIKATIKAGSLSEIASSSNSIVQKIDSITFNNPILPGIGNEPKLIGSVFNKSFINKISTPIAGNAGVFVISVNEVSAKQAQQEFSIFKEEVLNKTRSALFRSNVSLKKVAKIEDNRFKLF